MGTAAERVVHRDSGLLRRKGESPAVLFLAPSRAITRAHRDGPLVPGTSGGREQPLKRLNKVDVAVCTIEKANALVNVVLAPRIGIAKRDDFDVDFAMVVLDEVHVVGSDPRYASP